MILLSILALPYYLILDFPHVLGISTHLSNGEILYLKTFDFHCFTLKIAC